VTAAAALTLPSGAGADAGVGPLLGDAEFAAVAAVMMADARIHLPPTKRTLVQGRLARRLRMHGLDGFRPYLALVRADAAERQAMVTALTTNHTHFFRERHHFDHLRDELLPRLRAGGAGGRIWSAGCSSGEEVYSIAMTLLGTDRAGAAWTRTADLKLLATDIAPPVVDAVRAATYAAQAADAIPEAYRLWTRAAEDVGPGGARAEMAPEARALVTARVLNLFAPWPMRRRYDAIFCRNVMIYFDDEAKAELEARLVERLAPGGFLYIGHSERLVGPAAAATVSCGQTIYRLKGDAR